MKKKVIVVTSCLSDGGAERVAVSVANGFSSVGDEVKIYCFENGHYAEELLDSVEIVIASHQRTRKNIICFSNLLKTFRPDIIFCSQTHIGFMVILAKVIARLKGVKIIVREANTPSENRKSHASLIKQFIFKGISRFVFTESDIAVATCHFVKEDMRAYYRLTSPIHVLYNPIDANEIIEKSKSTCAETFFNENLPVVLAIGRLTHAKNYPFLINAFSILNEKLPCRLLILGEGNKRQELEDYIVEKNLEGKVKLLGFKKNPFPYIAKADLLALTSRYEGYPNVLIQANVLGKKAVALDTCGGVMELLSKSCISPAGDVAAFANLMHKQMSTLTSPELNLENYQSNTAFVNTLKQLLE
ncbi:MAG: glycosyltransferase [Pseudomonadales bacterium]|nr:glycosyltransferase [Pseudomonadales bacterium]